MTRLPRFHPLTTRLLALLATLALLTAQTWAAAHAAGDCHAPHFGYGLLAEGAAQALHGHDGDHAESPADLHAGPAHDPARAEVTGSTCSLCVFNTASSQCALLAARTALVLPLSPRAEPPTAPPAAQPAGRTPVPAPARGPPTTPLRA